MGIPMQHIFVVIISFGFRFLTGFAFTVDSFHLSLICINCFNDHFNGIDCITEEEVVRIFGDDHPIIGVDFEGVTKVRIKDAIEDFFNYLSAMKEFRMIYDAYMKYMEAKEDKDIDTLKVYASNEKDPEKKAKMEEAIADYYYQKNLDFIPKELSDKTIKTLVSSVLTVSGKYRSVIGQIN